ncbi:4-hydroxy-3-methylbut-2-enyl diphosphate reductase [Streptomyces sp. NPDC057271]|uniref:4-hydroxy-3-methylbut-2-enyl diphosphate reductase n=1 Tax=unclassified Streptomyces TaxID=2593676 RepID=UPI0036310F77
MNPRNVVVCAGRANTGGDEREPGELAVATEIRDGSGWVHRFPAAPLLAAALERRGLRTRSAAMAADGTADVAEVRVDPATAAMVRSAADRPVALLAEVGTAQDDGAEARRRAIDDVRAAWERAMGGRQVLLAGPRSFCAGVERAIEIVERALEQRGSPVYVRKQIVHNVHVIRELESRGAVFVDEVTEVPQEATVVFSAHGVAPAVRQASEARGLRVIDGTCPLVAKVHSEARRFAERGDTIVLIGHAGHEESEGTLGEAPDRTVLVESVEDVARLDVDGPVSYLMQTTLAVEEAARTVGALRERFPHLDGPASDDICYATTNRQEALQAVAVDVDLVLVVGSSNSSNSVRLVETARRAGRRAHLIDSPSDIELEWLAGCRTVGVTAGASAPPPLVDAVIDALRGLGPVTVAERTVTEETMRFNLPKEVR